MPRSMSYDPLLDRSYSDSTTSDKKKTTLVERSSRRRLPSDEQRMRLERLLKLRSERQRRQHRNQMPR